ncbi:hypothetical protein H2200_004611 [Cladophialophora chaetospira]|uniref:Uncharacterized protein n=1 Tax=Cladophialophora chaetospira TaxID=386627 RepID=A0AA38XDI1_9EURO|nr:hypothetical protein H2200_004611 [Cladophialophora chaetospira]
MVSIFTGLALIALFFTSTTSAFSGNFELTNLFIASPIQADPFSTVSTHVEFDFCDQDTPEVGPTRCEVEWAVGLSPPKSGAHTCDNSSFIVTITKWSGVGNLTLDLAHEYIDNRYSPFTITQQLETDKVDSVGQAPYNVLTKHSNFTLSYPITPFYECDMDNARCQSCEGEAIIANITTAIA